MGTLMGVTHLNNNTLGLASADASSFSFYNITVILKIIKSSDEEKCDRCCLNRGRDTFVATVSASKSHLQPIKMHAKLLCGNLRRNFFLSSNYKTINNSVWNFDYFYLFEKSILQVLFFLLLKYINRWISRSRYGKKNWPLEVYYDELISRREA